jgi:hypothetical protein
MDEAGRDVRRIARGRYKSKRAGSSRIRVRRGNRLALEEISKGARRRSGRPVIKDRNIMDEWSRDDCVIEQVGIWKRIKDSIACPDGCLL